MNGKIFLINNDKTLQPMTEQAYVSEDLLQTFLEEYPDLLAGDQINTAVPRRWMLVSREYGVPGETDGYDRWSLDHLFLDQDAVPTLVEVKRSSDTRIRREVVGQMLDYAANAVVYWPVETMRARFEARCDAGSEDAESRVRALVDASPDDGQVVEVFWNRVKTNLQAGKIRMLFVADVIPDELKRIIEFMNEQMDPAEVLGVEIRQFVGKGLRTLVPQVIGMTAAAGPKPGGGPVVRRGWNEALFFEAASKRLPAGQLQAMNDLYALCQSLGAEIRWGSGTSGSFNPRFQQIHPTIAPFTVYGDGIIHLKTAWFNEYPTALPYIKQFGSAMRRLFPSVPENFVSLDSNIPVREWQVHLDEVKQAIADSFGPDASSTFMPAPDSASKPQ